MSVLSRLALFPRIDRVETSSNVNTDAHSVAWSLSSLTSVPTSGASTMSAERSGDSTRCQELSDGPATQNVQRSRKRKKDKTANIKFVAIGSVMALLAAIISARLPGHGLVQGHLSIGMLALVFVLLAVSFGLAELIAENFVTKSGSHSFSLREFPFAIGLLLLPPVVTFFAVLIGLGLAFSWRRQIPMARVGFNVSSATLSASLGLSLALHVAPEVTQPGFRAWTVALASVVMSTALGSLFTHIAQLISGRVGGVANLVDSTVSGCSYAAASTSLAVLVVWAACVDFSVLVLIVPLVALTFSSFRNALGERAKRGETEFLYNTLQLMSDQQGVEFGLAGVARALRTALRAEETTLCVHTPEGWLILQEDPPLLVPLKGEPMTPTQSLRSELGEGRLFLRRRVDGGDGPLALIEVQQKVLGRSGFSDRDLHLLDSLADQLGVHLANSGLSRMLVKLAAAEKKLWTQLHTDSLTGLANRAWLHTHAAEETPTAVILIDLDGFKNVNDTLGHDVGDQVLHRYGETLLHLAPTGWVPVRLGGDEFALVRVLTTIPTLGEVENLLGLVELESVSPQLVAELGVPLGASAGGAASTSQSDDLDELLRRADTAMYAAKRARKDASAKRSGRVGTPRPAAVAAGLFGPS
jgi:diguanylate cyclase (GGDEF)-like protein